MIILSYRKNYEYIQEYNIIELLFSPHSSVLDSGVNFSEHRTQMAVLCN